MIMYLKKGGRTELFATLESSSYHGVSLCN